MFVYVMVKFYGHKQSIKKKISFGMLPPIVIQFNIKQLAVISICIAHMRMTLIKLHNNVKVKININSKQVAWEKLGKVIFPCINKTSNFNHPIS